SRNDSRAAALSVRDFRASAIEMDGGGRNPAVSAGFFSFAFKHDEIERLMKSAQPHVHRLFSASGLAAPADGTGHGMRMALSRDFDAMAVVVDWLDACRNQNLDQLLDAYAVDAELECACEGVSISGRAALAAYWKPQLAAFAPAAFGIEEIKPTGAGV